MDSKEVVLKAFDLAIQFNQGRANRATVDSVKKAFEAEVQVFQDAKSEFLKTQTRTK